MGVEAQASGASSGAPTSFLLMLASCSIGGLGSTGGGKEAVIVRMAEGIHGGIPLQLDRSQSPSSLEYVGAAMI